MKQYKNLISLSVKSFSFCFLITLSTFICCGQQKKNEIQKIAIKLNSNDFIILLDISESISTQSYDSFGNKLKSEPLGIYVLKVINNEYQLLSIKKYDYLFQNLIANRKPLTVKNSAILTYNIDSVREIYNEEIQPYICKNDSLNYYYTLGSSSHESSILMVVKTSDFQKTYEFGLKSFEDFYKKFGWYNFRNLNYEYNTRTTVFRLFSLVYQFIKDNLN